MKKIITTLISFIVPILLLVGCNNRDIEDLNMYKLALEEAKKISSEQGYTLMLDTATKSDVLIENSMIVEITKSACIRGGYLEEDLNNITKHTKIISYELVEKSKLDGDIKLYILVNKDKVIGAYLGYENYLPGIEPIDNRDFFK